MTVKSRASAGITRRHWYQVCGQPWTISSGGPAPPITACNRTPVASMYRLLNTSTNPRARFGAPAAEPGPRGDGREAALLAAAESRGRRLPAVTAAEAARTFLRVSVTDFDIEDPPAGERVEARVHDLCKTRTPQRLTNAPAIPSYCPDRSPCTRHVRPLPLGAARSVRSRQLYNQAQLETPWRSRMSTAAPSRSGTPTACRGSDTSAARSSSSLVATSTAPWWRCARPAAWRRRHISNAHGRSNIALTWTRTWASVPRLSRFVPDPDIPELSSCGLVIAMANHLQHDKTRQHAMEVTMPRRNPLTPLAAALTTALAACHPSAPTTSVSALSYGFDIP